MCFSVEVEKELAKLAKKFRAEKSEADFEYFGSLKQKHPKLFRECDDHNRIYPGSFTSVIVNENGKRLLKPMRYRVRPHGSKEEIPSKFNVFNARLDSLENRATWEPLFMKKHGIFPFRRFFEWVEDNGKKRLISFAPADREIMWAPCLWDHWESGDKELSFYSFALITDEPPPEILQMGHDRCPVFLKEECIDEWLNPIQNKKLIKESLKNIEAVTYTHEWVQEQQLKFSF